MIHSMALGCLRGNTFESYVNCLCVCGCVFTMYNAVSSLLKMDLLPDRFKVTLRLRNGSDQQHGFKHNCGCVYVPARWR